jgi:hypothetical protein
MPWYEDDANLTPEQSFYLINQRRDISTMGGRQLLESEGPERLLVDRLAFAIKPLLRIFPASGSRILAFAIKSTNRNSYLKNT